MAKKNKRCEGFSPWGDRTKGQNMILSYITVIYQISLLFFGISCTSFNMILEPDFDLSCCIVKALL
jgi:hypothetical protein